MRGSKFDGCHVLRSMVLVCHLHHSCSLLLFLILLSTSSRERHSGVLYSMTKGDCRFGVGVIDEKDRTGYSDRFARFADSVSAAA